MDTLRGVFKKPSVLPKRDERVKEAQVKKGPAANGTTKPAVPRTQRRTLDQLIAIKAASENFNKVSSSGSLNLGRRNSAASSASRSSAVSTTREISSQTGDINDDRFLKDVIIRIPSAKVWDQLKSTEDNNVNGSDRRTLSHRKQKSAAFKWDVTGSGGRKPVDEFEQQRNAHLATREKFSRMIAVSWSKEFDDSTEFSSIEQNYVQNRVSQMHQQQQDSPVYEEHTSIATVSSHSFNFIGNGKPSSSTGSSRTTTSKMDLPASYRVGELPKYMKEINEDKAERRRVEAEIDPNCPEGHVALSEQERIDALQIADKSFKRLVDELNKMPLTSQTLKNKHRKMEIEKELKQMEENIRNFSRLKVYVKIDEKLRCTNFSIPSKHLTHSKNIFKLNATK